MSDDVKVDERPAVCVCNVRPEGNTKLHDWEHERPEELKETRLKQRWVEKHARHMS